MTAPYYTDDHVTLWHGDCLDVLRGLPDGSVDAVVTDPPYSLSFMGREWDHHTTPEEFQTWCTEWATECLRVLKPGGHLLSFGGSRTWHRLACAIEDAGFEIRDSIAWLYGSGFPKSLDVSKAIDKAAGVDRPVLDTIPDRWAGKSSVLKRSLQVEAESVNITAPATPAAEKWAGWGTALKPAFEPIVVARKPLAGTVAANVLEHGTGALNIDGCRVGDEPAFTERRGGVSVGGLMNDTDAERITTGGAGRWPTNVTLDDGAAAELDRQSGESASSDRPRRNTAEAHNRTASMGKSSKDWTTGGHNDTGGASRFFPTFRYEAKADRAERPRVDGVSHPTVKPLALMRWLLRLITPPGGTVLEPFAGSGTTIEACVVEGFKCVAIEREAEYLPLIEARIARRTNAARALELTGDDLGLFGLLDDTEDGAA